MKMRTYTTMLLAWLVIGSAFAEETAWRPSSAESGSSGPSFSAADFYPANCALCHGGQLEGTTLGPALYGADLAHGDSVEEIVKSIQEGFPEKNMPAWGSILSEEKAKQIALFLTEIREDLSYETFNYDSVFSVPVHAIQSEELSFVLETVAVGLAALPFSIEPLPDGRILLTERKKGLRLISVEGEPSEYIIGTPRTYGTSGMFRSVKQEYGHGWMMDVKIHPDYKDNGWVYIHYGDRCEQCNSYSRKTKDPVSMNRLIRGRIRDGHWIDEEVIWEARREHYGPVPDLGGGGRTAFDESGHVFFSVGMQGLDNHRGIQDLSIPWGKVHRIKDDGSLPVDNPFYYREAALKSVWTYGHRSPQGLEYRRETNDLWSTEMGPRGGDELNRLAAGRNYGWPLYSKGINYDGTTINYGKNLGIEFDLEDIEQPVVDFTPSPAVSSFVFYSGAAFPEWSGDIIMGSLKARTLYRMVLEENRVVHTEKLVTNLARFRDIEIDSDGHILVLLEHNTGSRIIKLKPAR